MKKVIKLGKKERYEDLSVSDTVVKPFVGESTTIDGKAFNSNMTIIEAADSEEDAIIGAEDSAWHETAEIIYDKYNLDAMQYKSIEGSKVVTVTELDDIFSDDYANVYKVEIFERYETN